MTLTEAQHAEFRADIARRDRQSTEISDRVIAAARSLPVEGLRAILRLYVDEVGYLGEHHPSERENVTRFPCSNETYHRCSFTGRHDPSCKAAGGDGDVSANGYKSARSCEANCETAGTDEPWCHCSGFDCWTCDMVDSLLGLLAAHEVA